MLESRTTVVESPHWPQRPYAEQRDRAYWYIVALFRGRDFPVRLTRVGNWYSYDSEEWWCVDCYARKGASHLSDCRAS